MDLAELTRWTADRLLANSMPEPNSGCWLWLGGVTRSGHAALGEPPYTGQMAAFEAGGGVCLPGHHRHHTCRTPGCVNPDHVVQLSTAEHGAEHTHEVCSEGHPLTPENVYQRPCDRVCRTCHRRRQREYEERRKGC